MGFNLADIDAGDDYGTPRPRTPSNRSMRGTVLWMVRTAEWELLKDLPASALVAYGFIEAASRGPRRGQWTVLPKAVRDNYTHKWWIRALAPLIDTGLVAVDSMPGKVRRLRLLDPLRLAT